MSKRRSSKVTIALANFSGTVSVADTLIFDFQAYELSVVQRAVVAAAAGVELMELGTWDVEAARRANAAIQKGQ